MIKRYDPAGYFGGHAVEHPQGDYVLFTDHEADKQELILANKALGKKCTELEAARDYNAGLCEKLEKENGRLREALEKIDGHIVCDSSDAAAMFQEIAREARKGKP